MTRSSFLAIIGLSVALALAGCDNQEMANLQTAKAAAEQTTANTAAVNKRLADDAVRLRSDLAVERQKVAALTQEVADEKVAKMRERQAKAVARIRLEGAKAVAGTAVDRAHAKGVQVGKDGGKPSKKQS